MTTVTATVEMNEGMELRGSNGTTWKEASPGLDEIMEYRLTDSHIVAFRTCIFWTRLKVGDEEIELDHATGFSPWYYVDAEVLAFAEAKEKYPQDADWVDKEALKRPEGVYVKPRSGPVTVLDKKPELVTTKPN
jgi:hypothetical protein